MRPVFAVCLGSDNRVFYLSDGTQVAFFMAGIIRPTGLNIKALCGSRSTEKQIGAGWLPGIENTSVRNILRHVACQGLSPVG
jgi:hypothetical protein